VTIRGVLLLVTATGVAPMPVCGDARFYDRNAEGWFWYAPDPSTVPEPDPEPPGVPLVVTEPQETAPADSPSGPAPLSSAWLRANLERYQQHAIDDPTATNVALYLYLQRIALDKASRFADAYQRVVQSDPYLDETTRRPVGNYANLLNRVAGRERRAVLADLAGEAGLWFFYRSDCPYCAAQAPVLGFLSRQTGFRVQAIALDARPLPGGDFAHFLPDAGQAARLGVVSTPALFLVRPPSGIVPIAQGLLSLSDLEQRLLSAAREAGWIDEASYARTRPLVADWRVDWGQAARLEVPEDPNAFLALLRARVASGGAIAVSDWPLD